LPSLSLVIPLTTIRFDDDALPNAIDD